MVNRSTTRHSSCPETMHYSGDFCKKNKCALCLPLDLSRRRLQTTIFLFYSSKECLDLGVEGLRNYRY